MRKAIVIVIAIVVLGGVAWVGLQNKRNTLEENQQVFFSKEECEKVTEKVCGYQTCDYIPPGKTFEEVCSKDFKKGWVPSDHESSKIDVSIWKTYRNEKYGFEFRHPSNYRVEVVNGTRSLFVLSVLPFDSDLIVLEMDIYALDNNELRDYYGGERKDCETIAFPDEETTAYQCFSQSSKTTSSTQILFQRGGMIFSIGYSLAPSLPEVLTVAREILSTFKSTQ